MTKLLILDKDGTLTRPKSGPTWVQHPEDQELIPGVAETLQRYRDDGWGMAIVTNQGGCATFEIAPQDAKVGTFHVRGGLTRRIDRVSSQGGPVLISLADGDEFVYERDRPIPVCHKRVEDAIEETIYACKLAGITSAFLCPSSPNTVGDVMVSIDFADGNWRSLEYTREDWHQRIGQSIEGFRKPLPGMLQAAINLSIMPTEILMVGDRTEDEGAAQAAGVSFMWADKWLQKEKI
jgi:histidinol phosphatase-like enzyme